MEKNFAKPAIEHTNTPPTFPIPSIVQVSRHSIDKGIYQLLEVRAVQRVTVNKKVHIERERRREKEKKTNLSKNRKQDRSFIPERKEYREYNETIQDVEDARLTRAVYGKFTSENVGSRYRGT